MSSDLYFFDQPSRASRINGFHRSKRDSKDFDQALYHVKIASSLDNDHADAGENNRSIPIRKQTNDTALQQFKKTILPQILIKELDSVLNIFNEESKTNSPSSSQSRSPDNNNEEFINPTSNLPKVSLPAELIVRLHLTWSDLIKNTNYKYRVK